MDETLHNTGVVLGGLLGLGLGFAVRAAMPQEYGPGGVPKEKSPFPVALGFLGGIMVATLALPKPYQW